MLRRDLNYIPSAPDSLATALIRRNEECGGQRIPLAAFLDKREDQVKKRPTVPLRGKRWVEFGMTLRPNHPIWPPVASAHHHHYDGHKPLSKKDVTSQGTARPRVTRSCRKVPESDS